MAPAPPSNQQPARALLVAAMCAAPFVVVLDSNIVTVALPSIRSEFGFSPQALQWVMSANYLTFGGFLLVGGRAADVHGRRRSLLRGLLVFSVASLAGGLAVSPTMLLGARALQGVGAALAFPAAISLLTSTFQEGAPRNRALGAFGALISLALVTGTALGGLLTELVGWRAVLFVNVPLGVLGLIGGSLVIPKSPRRNGTLASDLPRAASATIGLIAVLYALTEVRHVGWTSLETALLVLLALGCAAVAYLADRRSPQPLLTRQVLGRPTVAAAGVAALLTTGTGVGVVVVLSLYLQDILGHSPLHAGLALALLGVAGVVSGNASRPLASRFGVTHVLVAALLVQALGVLVMVAIEAASGLGLVLIGTSIMGLGHFGANVMFTALGTTGIPPADQGVTVGVINSAQQVGGGLGLAMLMTVASTRTDAAQASAGDRTPGSIVAGFQWALATGGVLSIVAACVVLAIVRTSRPPDQAA